MKIEIHLNTMQIENCGLGNRIDMCSIYIYLYLDIRICVHRYIIYLNIYWHSNFHQRLCHTETSCAHKSQKINCIHLNWDFQDLDAGKHILCSVFWDSTLKTSRSSRPSKMMVESRSRKARASFPFGEFLVTFQGRTVKLQVGKQGWIHLHWDREALTHSLRFVYKKSQSKLSTPMGVSFWPPCCFAVMPIREKHNSCCET